MRQISVILGSILSLGLFASLAHADDYKIEVCKVSLSITSGIEPLSSWHHSYVKKTTPTGSQTLNFDPEDLNNLQNLISGPSKVTHRDWGQAKCKPVFVTSTKEEFEKKWCIINKYFYHAQDNTNYSFYDGNGKNCHYIAAEAIKAAGLNHPFPEILLEGPGVKTVMKRLLKGLSDFNNFLDSGKDANCNPM